MNIEMKLNNNLPEMVTDFFTYLSTIKNVSDNTIQGYSNDLSLYFKYMKKLKYNLVEEFDDIDITDIDVNFIKNIKLVEIHKFMGYVKMERNNGECARSRKTSSIKSFYTYLQNIVEAITSKENATLRLEKPTIAKRSPVVMTLPQAKLLIDSVEEGTYYSKRDKAIIVILLNCCLRREEVSMLNLESIQNNMMEIIGKGNKQRWLNINSSCDKVITDWLEDRLTIDIKKGHENALFISKKGLRLSKGAVGDIVKKYVTKAGLDPTKFTTHKLRSTGATIMYQTNKDLLSISKILGHESIKTTTIYVSAGAKEMKNTIDSNPLNCLC